MVVLDAILWLTPRGEIAIPMSSISHDRRALSIGQAALPRRRDGSNRLNAGNLTEMLQIALAAGLTPSAGDGRDPGKITQHS